MRQLLVAVLIACASLATVNAQDVLDRVVARVDGQPITLSETRAAIRLKMVETPDGVDPILVAMRELIERRLVLSEVARYSPPDPDPATVQNEVNALKSRVGGSAELAQFERTTGVGEEQFREIARDNARIQAYLNQRFGPSTQPTDDEVGQYYRTHLEEFQVNGQAMPFVQAEPIARQKVAAQRRSAIILQWTRELRQRADVVELYPGH